MYQLTSDRHDRARQNKRRRALITLVALFLGLFLLRNVLFPSLSGTLHFIARPLWAVQSAVGGWASSVVTQLRSKSALEEENTRLREQVNALSLDGYSRAFLREENDVLKEMYGRPREYDLVLATVLARPNKSPYDTLVIDIGADAMLAPGMRVMTDGDFILGEVAAVYEHSALVKFYSSSGTELPVLLGSSTPIAETAHGIGGGNFRVALPRGAEVVEGDMVTLPDLGPAFTGVVERIDAPESSSFAVVYFKLPVNWNELKYVYVAFPRTIGDMKTTDH